MFAEELGWICGFHVRAREFSAKSSGLKDAMW